MVRPLRQAYRHVRRNGGAAALRSQCSLLAGANTKRRGRSAGRRILQELSGKAINPTRVHQDRVCCQSARSSVGVIVTRCDQLQEILEAIGRGESFGNSTTLMGKLLPRVHGAVGTAFDDQKAMGRSSHAWRRTGFGRSSPLQGEGGKVRNRRNLLVAAGCGEDPLTESAAAAQLWEDEPLFMPHSGPLGSPDPAQWRQRRLLGAASRYSY
jgi:hypothetical protein